MTKTTELRPFTKLSPDEDPQDVAALVRSAQDAPDEDLPRLRWRLRASLRQSARPRRFLRMALVAGSMFITGGMVGAVVGRFVDLGPARPATTAEPPAKAKPPAIRKPPVRAAAEVVPPLPAAAEPASAVAVADALPAPATAPSQPAPARPARRAAAPAALPAPPSPPEAALARALPSPVAVEQALLGDILRWLRAEHNPQAALTLLDEHAKRFPGTALGPELAMLRAEALLGLGRRPEALSLLDRLPLGSMPNRDERLVLRGELRAAAGRWREAREDFETQLSEPLASGADAKSRDVKGRALWGRASARSHLGDEAGARADLAWYLQVFPSGRFAAQAAVLLQGAP